MDLSSTEYNNKHVLQQRLLDKINEHHRLGDLIVSPEGFIFSAFDGNNFSNKYLLLKQLYFSVILFAKLSSINLYYITKITN